MVIPDINVLIYAYDSTSPNHPRAKEWLEQLIIQEAAVGIPWVVILGFIRIMTNPRVQRNPLAIRRAVHHVRQWLAQPNVCIITPGERHADILFDFLDQIGTGGNLTTDAHLAALAVEYKAVLATTDVDLTRFAGVRLINPLASRPNRPN
jgi:toxin-antitoxin system PIN domain toxin